MTVWFFATLLQQRPIRYHEKMEIAQQETNVQGEDQVITLGGGNVGWVEDQSAITDLDDDISSKDAGDGEQSSSNGGETHFDFGCERVGKRR